MFVAIDPIGGIPYFLTLTSRRSPNEKIKLLLTAITTAAIALLLFLAIGHALLQAMGITLHDFEVGGGLVILTLAIRDILSTSSPFESNATHQGSNQDIGIVPLGIPLLAGPASFTTEILLLHHAGLALTLISVMSNLLLTAILFYLGHYIVSRFLPPKMLEAIGRFVELLLCGYGVMMIRSGLGIRTIPLF
jgi:multiple antibiotic resistance protein